MEKRKAVRIREYGDDGGLSWVERREVSTCGEEGDAAVAAKAERAAGEEEGIKAVGGGARGEK